jgi:hypothetical protein
MQIKYIDGKDFSKISVLINKEYLSQRFLRKEKYFNN